MGIKDLPEKLQPGNIIELVELKFPIIKQIGYYLGLNKGSTGILISSIDKGPDEEIDEIPLAFFDFLSRYKPKEKFKKINRFDPIELSSASGKDYTKRVGYIIGFGDICNDNFITRLSPRLERFYVADGLFEKNSGIEATNIRCGINDQMKLLKRRFFDF